MSNSQTIELRLLGQKILLRASDSEPETIRKVVELVSSKLKTAERRGGKNNAPHQVTILALLDLAEDYIHAKEKTLQYKRELAEKSAKLLSLIEADSK